MAPRKKKSFAKSVKSGSEVAETEATAKEIAARFLKNNEARPSAGGIQSVFSQLRSFAEKGVEILGTKDARDLLLNGAYHILKSSDPIDETVRNITAEYQTYVQPEILKLMIAMEVEKAQEKGQAKR